MHGTELNRIWRLISEASPKGVWLELRMLEQWAQAANERHGGVPAEHLSHSFAWAARRLNWQAQAAPVAQTAQGPGPAWPDDKKVEAAATTALASDLTELAPPTAPAMQPLARRGQVHSLADWQRPLPQTRALGQESLPTPRPSPSLAERQRKARREGRLIEAMAMAERHGGPQGSSVSPSPNSPVLASRGADDGAAPHLWANEGGELLPEWAQVLGLHEHPVAHARKAALERKGAWEVGVEDVANYEHAPTVAELLARGPSAWIEPSVPDMNTRKGPGLAVVNWRQLGAKLAAPFGLGPEQFLAAFLVGLSTLLLVFWA